MVCRLLLTRLARILKRHAVGYLNISSYMVRVVRNWSCEEGGFRLTIPSRLLAPGRSLFSRWNRRAVLLLIYCACLLFFIQKLSLKKSLSLVLSNLVQRFTRLQAIHSKSMKQLSCCCATRSFDALPK